MSTIQAGHQATVSVDVGAAELRFETGKLAKQADGAVVVRSGDTMILATAVGRQDARPDADFFPLTVDVEERMYAAGKIPGGFFKREGRATERATLTARMIDRPIRPLWPKGFKNEVQVICTVLSADMVVPHDILAINGASAALAVSPLPFLGPGRRRPDRPDRGRAGRQPDVPAAGRVLARPRRRRHPRGADDDRGRRRAGARRTRCSRRSRSRTREIIRICDAIDELAREVGKPKWIDVELNAELEARHGEAVARRVAEVGLREAGGDRRRAARDGCPGDHDGLGRGGHRPGDAGPQRRCRCCSRRSGSPRSRAPCARSSRTSSARSPTPSRTPRSSSRASATSSSHRIQDEMQLPFPVGEGDEPVKDSITRSYVKKAADAIYKDLVRKKIAIEKRRPDGRGTEEIRPITTEVGVSPRTHGSALFTRGQTQILTLCTLGTAKEQQRIDDLSIEQERRYMHHYNFPPYSVGETGFMRGPKRRDIGHGALAQRALESVIPAARGVPVHDPPRLRDARVERLVVDGLGVRVDDVPDARRRADRGAGLRHRHGPRQGGRRLRHPHRHPGRGGPPR